MTELTEFNNDIFITDDLGLATLLTHVHSQKIAGLFNYYKEKTTFTCFEKNDVVVETAKKYGNDVNFINIGEFVEEYETLKAHYQEASRDI